MTTDALAGELADGSQAALPVSQILDLCNRRLREVGRRQHLFGWLRAPGAGPEQWLPVDAYYPRSRLVVVCHDEPLPHDDLYRELVPEHGLHLLELAPRELSADREHAELALGRLLEGLGPAPVRASAPQAQARPIARVVASLAQPPAPPVLEPRRVGQSQAAAAQRAARFVAAHRTEPVRRPAKPGLPAAPAHRSRQHEIPIPRRAARAPAPAIPPARGGASRARRGPGAEHPPSAGEGPMIGVGLGLTALAVLVVEVYLGVEVAGLEDGQVALAFGLALDACSRALGTIAAARAGQEEWAWGCAIGGSPGVAAFALFQRSGPVSIEPAPLAGVIGLLAGLLVAVGIAASALGG